MEYVQERIATLHDLADPVPDAPTDRAAVVVPMMAREHASLGAERVLTALQRVEPDRVIVALRADASAAPTVADWLDGFDLPLEIVWCDGPRLADRVAAADLDGRRGKGRDVWLGLGVAAADSEYVVLHDADARTYSERHVTRLLYPLANGFQFAKGYYARVENDRLYGRLFRLFYCPLVRALADESDAPILSYLRAFRYALAGEFAATRAVTRSLRVPRGWGLEVGTLGDAFDVAGFDGTAQVDLGRYEHDHRAVSGPSGLSTMSDEVGAALLRVVEEHGVSPAYATLPDRYREAADEFVDAYAIDAAFNGLEYDRGDERSQVDAYGAAVRPPGDDARLPPWAETTLSPRAVSEAATADLEAIR